MVLLIFSITKAESLVNYASKKKFMSLLNIYEMCLLPNGKGRRQKFLMKTLKFSLLNCIYSLTLFWYTEFSVV